MNEFQAFFSYSHHDARTTQSTTEAFSAKLEDEVNAKLTNARFKIWRDVDRLRTGERWNERIAEAISNSHIMIILITPKWIESDYCRKEFDHFCSEEPEFGEYIVPLLIRSLEKQFTNFSADQIRVYNLLRQRQYMPMSNANYSSLKATEKTRLMTRVADDIEGMIERLRLQEKAPAGCDQQTKSNFKSKPQFTVDAHNYRDVDFISHAEVVIDKNSIAGYKSVYAHIDFIHRLYVQTSSARVEFGVRRAYLSVDDDGKYDLSRNEQLLGASGQKTAYYVTFRESRSALSLCIEPPSGKLNLQELCLPVSPGENRFSNIGSVRQDVDHKSVKAKLIVALRAESLHVFPPDGGERPATNSTRKITAIINAMIEKERNGNSELLEREIEVKERNQ